MQQVLLVVGGNDLREGATRAELLYDILTLVQECGSVLFCMASVFPPGTWVGVQPEGEQRQRGLQHQPGTELRTTQVVTAMSAAQVFPARWYSSHTRHQLQDRHIPSSVLVFLPGYFCNFVC